MSSLYANKTSSISSNHVVGMFLFLLIFHKPPELVGWKLTIRMEHNTESEFNV